MKANITIKNTRANKELVKEMKEMINCNYVAYATEIKIEINSNMAEDQLNAIIRDFNEMAE